MTRQEVEKYPKVAAAWDRNVENCKDTYPSNDPNILVSAFKWNDTPEKHDFWSLVNKELLDKAKELRPDLFEEVPTIEDVRQYFKNVNEVRCLYDGIIYDLDDTDRINYCAELNSFWLRGDIVLWSGGEYAKIVSYKEEKEEFVWGEEVECSNDGEEWSDRTFIYIGKNRLNDCHIVVGKTSQEPFNYAFIRKPQIEEITKEQAEQLLKKLGKNVKIK